MVLAGGRSKKKKNAEYRKRWPHTHPNHLFVSELFRRNGKLKEGKHHFHIKRCPIQITKKQIASLESNTEIVSVK